MLRLALNPSTVLLALISVLSITLPAAAATAPLKGFAWRDRLIVNYEQLATVVREIDAKADAEDLIQSARRRGNPPSALGLVLDHLAPEDQDQFVANFKIDHPMLGNHAYARRVNPGYRAELERLVEMGLPVDEVATLVGAVPNIYGFGLTTLRERMTAFEGDYVETIQAVKWVIEAERMSEGRLGLGAGYRQEKFMRTFAYWSERLDRTDQEIAVNTRYRIPIDDLLNTRARILRRLARYGSDPKTIERARRRGIELEISNLRALQNRADGDVERARKDFELNRAEHNVRLGVRIGFIKPKMTDFDPASVRDQAAEQARADRLLELRAQLERDCSSTLAGDPQPARAEQK